MASAAPTIDSLLAAPNFRLNNVSFLLDAEQYLTEAHAVSCCLDEAASSEISMNNTIIQAAARAIGTLVHLAMIASESHAMQAARSERPAPPRHFVPMEQRT